MRAFSGYLHAEVADVMGPRVNSMKPNVPQLKSDGELRDAGYLIAISSRTDRLRRKHKNKCYNTLLLVLIIALLCLAISMTALYIKEKKMGPEHLCKTRECLRAAANLAVSMDKTADPCVDFYQYTCGKWSDEHPRPDAYGSYDWFRDKQNKVYSLVRDFLAQNSSDVPKPVQQARDMFTACMDTELLDKRGLQPVVDILSAVGLPPFPTFVNASELNYSSYSFNWLEVVIKVKTYLGMDILIGFDIYSDPKNSSTYRLVMGSPEYTDPFPNTYTKRKRYTYRKYWRNSNIQNKKYIYFSKLLKVKRSDEALDDEEKNKQLFILFYAEIIKLFVLHAKASTTPDAMEPELDKKLLVTAGEYYNIYSDMYDLEQDNSTEEYSGVTPEYTVKELQAHTDSIVENNNGTAIPIWLDYLKGIFSVSNVQLDFDTERIMVSDADLKYMALMAAFLSKEPPVIIELLIWVKVVEVLASHTTAELRALFQRSVEEVHEHRRNDHGVPPRSLQCASAVNDMLGMAVAYAIVNPKFTNITKPKVQTMIDEIKNSLSKLVSQAKWMDAETKIATYEKISVMRSLIGFPDWLLEDGKLEEYYVGVEISTQTHLENMISVIQCTTRSALNSYLNFKNYSWASDPTEVNAYHSFQDNTITVPLAILQYPFFDLGLDSLNYGSLGTVIGHEVTHGFDNIGRKFDKDGNMVPWWSNVTIESFVNMSQCFIDQYSSYYINELDQYVNGRKTLGENIADNGGVREAFGALRQHLAKVGPEPKLPGFDHMTSEQLFFLSYGNLWCEVSTNAYLQLGLEDEHSPQKFRARGALQNYHEFSRAFQCEDGAPMNPANKCVIF